jgi:PAS domain S-box-containing protein
MKGQLRKSGIDIIGDIPWGTHFCQFYQTKKDLMEILIPYFKAGLENNEFCLWITSEPLKTEEAKEALKRAIPDLNIYLERGQIEIVPDTSYYVKGNSFDLEKSLNAGAKKFNHALISGYDGLRASGNLSWLKKTDLHSFIDYEEKVDSTIGSYRIIALCTYSLETFSATEIIDFVVNHQFALIKREGKWEQIESPRRRKAEETAIQATKNWEYTFDAVPDSIAILDTEYRIVRANRAMAARLGITPKECVGLTCYRVIHGMDKPPSFCPYRQLLTDELEHTEEVREDSLGGDFILSVLPLRNSEGKLTGCIHFARDITERKKAEDALRDSEERLRFALETSHTGAWDLDLVDYSARRSLVHDRIFGYQQLLPQWTYEMFLDHVLPEDLEMVDAKFRKAISTHSEWNFECRIRRLDGAIRWIWAAGRHIEDVTENIHRMAGIVQDITERKEAEKAMQESEKRFRTLAENSPDVIARFDRNNRHLYANPAAVEPYGHSQEEIIGKTHTELRMNPEKVKFWEEHHEKVFATGKPETVEFHYRSPARREQYFNTRIVPEFVDGEVASVLAISRDITDIKETEAKLKETLDNLENLVKERTAELERAYNLLKESEKGLAEAQKMAHLGSWDWNIETNELYWSDEKYRIFGHNPQEFIPTYDTFLSYIHPDDKDYVNNAIRDALNGKSYSIDYRIILADGEERIIHVQGEATFDEKSTPVRIKGTVQDITERKKAEGMLRESESKFKALFELLPVGVSIIDKERNIIDANLALERILDLSRSDLFNRNYSTRKYLRSDGTEMPFEEYPSVKALEEKGSVKSSEIGMIKEDGSTIWTDVSATTLPFSDGQVVITTRDITESKKAKEELQKAEERYRMVTEQTGQMVYDYDMEKQAADLAGNIEELTGFIPDEFGSINLDFLVSRIHPEDLNKFMENYKKHFESSGGTYRTEYRFRKKNGEYIYFEDNGVCLRDKQGKVNRILGVIKDISERKKAEEAIKHVENARKKEIHHRIKNNLQVISSLLDLQAEKFRDVKHVGDSEVLKAFRESQDRVISIALIHEELHEGKGNDTLNFSPYLHRLVENLFQTYTLGNMDISLNMDLEENVFFDMDTAVPLGLIVNELVSNSLKYAFQGRDKGLIQIRMRREENREAISNRHGSRKEGHENTNFILTVSDDGTGIPESFSMENSDTLGIQLVTTLVDQLDGEIELKEGYGTEFIIRFSIKDKK